MPFIDAHQVCKRFNGHPRRQTVALDQLDLSVAQNEFVAIVGPSGCGKSTFLMMLAGLENPSSGRLTMEDRPVHGPDPQRAIVFQDYLLFPWKTVKANVAFGPELRGIARDRIDRLSQHFIQLVGLDGFEDRYPHELSGGMRQRVAIARALVNRPKVLLMDEPFGSLDALTREGLQLALLQIWQQAKCTVLFVTHSISEAVFLADRVVVMSRRPGRVKASVPIDLPRPRTQAHQATPRFKSYEMDLKKIVWEEV